MGNILSNSSTQDKFVIFIIIIAEIFWFIQFIHLMKRKDNSFPGRLDKPCWVVIFIILNVVGALAYMILKPLNQMTESEEIQHIKEDLTEQYLEPCLKCGKTIPKNSKSCPHCGWSYQKKEE